MQLVGRPQRRNAETAATAALVLRRRGYPRVGIEAIVAGLGAARLPGRFQVIRRAGDVMPAVWPPLMTHQQQPASGLHPRHQSKNDEHD